MIYKAIRYFLILIVLTLVVASCKKGIGVQKSTIERLTDEWKWAYSSGGFSGGLILPEIDKVKTITFKNNGVYIEQENGEVVEKHRYKIIKRESNFGDVYSEQLRRHGRQGFTETIIFENEDDVLMLWEECSDCYTHYYSRVK